MAMYKHARTRIRSYDGSVSEWFGVNVGVHQGSVLSPLLFIIVMEAVTHSVREGLPWEMLYADDLVLVGKYEELKEKLRKWNECLKDKGLKINEDKTKVMCESFGSDTTQVIGNVKHPCSVCLKGVGVNSIRCTQCVQWVHARYSRVKGSLEKVESSFICRRCKGELCETRQVNNQVNDLHIDGHEYEKVDKLYYLGDMLSQEGGCEHAILKRIQTGWLKFMELFRSAYRKRDECEVKRNYLYNMHKTCNVVWQ